MESKDGKGSRQYIAKGERVYRSHTLTINQIKSLDHQCTTLVQVYEDVAVSEAEQCVLVFS